MNRCLEAIEKEFGLKSSILRLVASCEFRGKTGFNLNFRDCFSAEAVLAGTVDERLLLVYLSLLRRKVKAKEAKTVVRRPREFSC